MVSWSKRFSEFEILMKRNVVIIISVIVLIAGCIPKYERPLMVGTNNWTGYELLYLARDFGYYQHSNLRLVELGSASQVMDALRVGKLDVAALTLDEALVLAQEGILIKIVWVMNVSAGADAVITKTPLHSLHDLKNKRIGVEQTALGAYMLNSLLYRAELSTHQVQIVSLPLDEQLGAWKKNKIDALITFDPLLQTLKNKGAVVVLDSRTLPGEIVDVLVVRDAVLSSYPTQIRQLLAGQQQALSYLQQHPHNAALQIAKRSQSNAADIEAALAGVELPNAQRNYELFHPQEPAQGIVASAKKLADVMVEHGLLLHPLRTETLFDGRFTSGGRP